MGREDLDGADAAELPPVLAVRGPRHGGVAVAYDFPGEEKRAAGEYDVVSAEAFFDSGRRRDQKDWTGAEVEEEHRAETGRDVG